jgi:hypothetical protein
LGNLEPIENKTYKNQHKSLKGLNPTTKFRQMNVVLEVEEDRTL